MMTPQFESRHVQIYQGDALATLKQLNLGVDAVITSPPYFGLCNYEVDGQYGLEDSLTAYLENMVAVFRECRRLLPNGGTCWIVIGDSSNNSSGIRAKDERRASTVGKRRKIQPELPEKSILCVPHRLGASLAADGWIWRNTLIWDKVAAGTIAKSDTAPQTHEYILHLGKWDKRGRPYLKSRAMPSSVIRQTPIADKRHPCPFPPALATELISASSDPGDVILDPFAGTGTTLHQAQRLGRQAIGIELKPEFCRIAMNHCRQLSLFSPPVKSA